MTSITKRRSRSQMQGGNVQNASMQMIKLFKKHFHITEVYSADLHRCELILAQDLLSKTI